MHHGWGAGVPRGVRNLFISNIPPPWGGWRRETSLSPPVKIKNIFLLTIPGRCSFCGSFFVIFRVCHAFLSVRRGLVVPDRMGLISWLSLCGVLLCFVTFPCVVLGRMWYLIVSIPDLCHLLTFYFHLLIN